MTNFLSKTSRPLLALAPMAGFTASPFRQMVRSLEPSVILVSELISVEALRRKHQKTLDLCFFEKIEKNFFGIQLFGNNENSFCEAGKIVEDLGADFIDLNFGCPAPKIINSGNGSALLKNPKAAISMIEKLVYTVKIPVTIKMRLGFYDDKDILENTKNFESAGVSAIFIHGRTTKQKFSGISNWEKIYLVKKNLNIPIIGNGDIESIDDVKQKIKNLDGIMIGRAALKNPWIFSQIRNFFYNKKISEPTLEQKLKFFKNYVKLSIKNKDEKIAIIELRKHLSHFIRGIPNASIFRQKLMQITCYSKLEKIFNLFFRNAQKEASP